MTHADAQIVLFLKSLDYTFKKRKKTRTKKPYLRITSFILIRNIGVSYIINADSVISHDRSPVMPVPEPETVLFVLFGEMFSESPKLITPSFERILKGPTIDGIITPFSFS